VAEAEIILSDSILAQIPCCVIGTTGGDTLNLPSSSPLPLGTLREVFEGWMPAFMSHALEPERELT
jgi:hypothetical protein